MKIFEFNAAGKYVAAHNLEEGVVFDSDQLPMCTAVAPPELSEDYRAVWNGADWTIETTRRPS